MTSLLAIAMLAQRSDWIEGAIILGIVVLSALGSAGKWIVQQLAEKRERNARQREGMPIDPPRTTVTIHRDRNDEVGMPPTAAPSPPVLQRPRKTTMQPIPPVMERVMEVLLEKTAGTEFERRIREMMPPQPAPPPPPARTSEPRARKQAAPRAQQRQTARRPQTVAERAAHRDQSRQTEVEREARRLAQREQQFTDDTDQRLGHVVTHIAGAEAHESASADVYDFTAALDDADALRRAFVLSEILAPPLALRGSSGF